MDSILDRCVSVYHREGLVVLCKKILRKLYIEAYFATWSAWGHYSLTLDDRVVAFSAPTATLVKRNTRRFDREKQVIRDFLDEIRNADVVYDVGANTGLYSLFAATECQEGSVIAFEPYPPNFEVLKRDIARNGLSNVNVVESVLSNSNGEIQFSQPEQNDIGYGSSAIDAKDSEDGITVRTTTADTLVDEGQIPAPNVVKIDVEGAESLVIDGMERVLATPACRVVYCEVHVGDTMERPSIDDFGSSLGKLESKLQTLGFSTQRMNTKGDSEVMVKAKKLY